MPPKSKAQQRFMGMCAHADHPPARCPKREVAREFAKAPNFKKLPGHARKMK